MTNLLDKPARVRKWGLRLAAGVLMTAVVAYFMAREFNFRLVWAALIQANYGYLELAVGAMLSNIALKTLRWQWLFHREGNHLSRKHLLTALMIGQLGNALLPMRLGDIARIWVVSRRQQIGISSSLMTVVIEKAMDSFMLLAVLIALLPFIALPFWLGAQQLVLSGALVILLVIFILLSTKGALRQCLLHAVERLHAEPIKLCLRQALLAADELQALQESSVKVRLWLTSIAIWLLAGLVNHFGFRAVHLDLPFTAGLLLAVTEISGTNVAYAPASVGVYHFICILTLALFGVGFELALSAAILLHLIVYLPIAIGGLASVWLESLDLRLLMPL